MVSTLKASKMRGKKKIGSSNTGFKNSLFPDTKKTLQKTISSTLTPVKKNTNVKSLKLKDSKVRQGLDHELLHNHDDLFPSVDPKVKKQDNKINNRMYESLNGSMTPNNLSNLDSSLNQKAIQLSLRQLEYEKEQKDLEAALEGIAGCKV